MYPWIIVDSSSNTVSISRTDWPLIWRPAMTTALSITIEGSSCCWETTNLSSVWCWKNSAHDFGHFRAMIPASNFPSELHFLPTCSSKENSKMICNMHELEYLVCLIFFATFPTLDSTTICTNIRVNGEWQ